MNYTAMEAILWITVGQSWSNLSFMPRTATTFQILGNSISIYISLHLSTNLYIYRLFPIHLSRISGKVCRTNCQTTTGFRGFGRPQSMFVMETIMDHISSSTGISPDQVRSTNLFRDNQVSYTDIEST